MAWDLIIIAAERLSATRPSRSSTAI